MLEGLLVRDVMQRHVVTIHCQRSVAEAERLLVARRISGVPMVAQDGHLMGVVSKHDLARFRLEHPEADARAVMVYEIGTAESVLVGCEETIAAAARLMVQKHLHRLIVVHDGRPVGILSSLDMARLVARLA